MVITRQVFTKHSHYVEPLIGATSWSGLAPLHTQAHTAGLLPLSSGERGGSPGEGGVSGGGRAWPGWRAAVEEGAG